ncbi:UNVERIFIED_CONTAM: hypothetical protein GTU68_061576 [Idotea baltica]|nr:hypothetical protein [Idotea baltica]
MVLGVVVGHLFWQRLVQQSVWVISGSFPILLVKMAVVRLFLFICFVF